MRCFMRKELNVVKCPKCGREYLPAEIYMPKEFFCIPDLIKRDTEGCIVDYLGTSLDTSETYCCDLCNTTFNVVADIKFTTEVADDIDFNSQHATQLRSKLKVKEF